MSFTAHDNNKQLDLTSEIIFFLIISDLRELKRGVFSRGEQLGKNTDWILFSLMISVSNLG